MIVKEHCKVVLQRPLKENQIPGTVFHKQLMMLRKFVALITTITRHFFGPRYVLFFPHETDFTRSHFNIFLPSQFLKNSEIGRMEICIGNVDCVEV
jgi:hypothetical protein